MNSIFDHDEFEDGFEPTFRKDEPTLTWSWDIAIAVVVLIGLGLILVCAISG